MKRLFRKTFICPPFSHKRSSLQVNKKKFTLLEVVIAITLVALSAPLLFSIPFKLAKREIDLCFDTELHRVVDAEWGRLQSALITQDISQKTLLKAEKGSVILDETLLVISFTKDIQRTYLLKKELTQIKTKKISDDQEGKLLTIKISIHQDKQKKAHVFTYKIFLLSPTVVNS
ncbi:MAG: hypothetical protein KGZ30_00155 [Anaplasmataceae bacterium]|nr:hypothetical protein [Anaplasmataceae bacterium]